MIYAIIGICISLYVMWCLFHKKKDIKNASFLTDKVVQEYDSFQHGLKSETMKPETIVHYGKTRFAFDETTEKIFIQTSRIPQGMAIHCADITYYEMVRDGETIAPEAVFTHPVGLSEYAGETCSDLHITVWTADGSKVVLPILESPPGISTLIFMRPRPRAKSPLC